LILLVKQGISGDNMLRKLIRWYRGLCITCGREKGVWRDGTSICYKCGLNWKSENSRKAFFKHMGWDKRYPVKK
jgi:hypothetical protein